MKLDTSTQNLHEDCYNIILQHQIAKTRLQSIEVTKVVEKKMMLQIRWKIKEDRITKEFF